MRLNNFFKISSIITLFVLNLPNLANAEVGYGTLIDVSNTLANGVVTSLGYLMFTLAVVAFFWGIVQFIWAARQGDGGKGVENGKQFMLWGLISLFVMFSVWGIINFAQSVFGIKGQTTIVIPNIQLLGAPSKDIKNNTTVECVQDTACTTVDARNNPVSGFCNRVNQCVPSRGNIPQTTDTSPSTGCADGQVPDRVMQRCVKIGSECIVFTTYGNSTSTSNAVGSYDANGSCNTLP